MKSSLNLLREAARTTTAMVTLLTGLAFSTAQAQVVINEVMASNNRSVPLGADFPDWVEIYNAGSTIVNLGGYGLSDSGNITNAFKYRFPNPTQILPGQYLIVWCDGLTNASGLHANFSFSQNGESVRLYNPSSVLVDSIEFGPQITDLTVGRVPSGGPNWTLTKPTPQAANQAAPLGNPANLRINEWMAQATKSDGSVDEDWFEIYNPETNAVSMSRFVFTDSTLFPPTNGAMPDLYFIAPRGFIQIFADDKLDFENANFKLSSTSGDQIYMYASNRTTLIDRVDFRGQPQTANVSQGRLPDGSTNIVFFRPNQPTPAESNFLPITNVVFSEFLTHTDEPLEDAIELLNTSSAPADISGYWLSNSEDDPKKYRIPPNTVIPAGGRKVFYEYHPANGGVAACNQNGLGFNTSGTGEDRCFTLNSSRGDQIYLYSADAAGNLTGFRRGVDFGAAENGVSFGRWVTSDGNTDYPAMSARSFGADNPGTLAQFRTGTGAANPYPLVGPVVINEVMYRPPTVYITNGTTIITNDITNEEFIELHNITSSDIFLRHPTETTNGWTLGDAVDFNFPPSARIPANGYLLVVDFSPATNAQDLAHFKNRYGIPATFTNIYGPYRGKLKNSSGNVKLFKPDFIQPPGRPDAGLVPQILVDRIEYKDSIAHLEPADGQGASLQRRRRTEYGNDSANWFAAGPTPGRTNSFTGTVRASQIVRGPGNQTAIYFDAIQGQSYTVEYKDALNAVVWNTLQNPPVQQTNNTVVVRDFGFSPTGNRFYRITTPTYP